MNMRLYCLFADFVIMKNRRVFYRLDFVKTITLH